ncbi:MAG TPA: killer suppression protein [Propionibacteriaceae bacterium]|nr:killer suppression protein [Propionibacteriaceae bacterium]
MLFRTKKLARVFNSEKLLVQVYGPDNARLIMRRMSVLNAVPTLAEVPNTPPERRHELKGDRAGQFAVDVKHPYRIVFVPVGDPVPKLADGGYDLARITAIEILEVEDYH